METGRLTAFRVLRALEAGTSWERAWRDASGGGFQGSRERRFAHELVSGSVRLQARLDWILARHARRPLEDLDPAVRVLLRLGLYQLVGTTGVADHAAVHATVEVAKRHVPRGAAFINAVLRAVLRQPGPVPFPDPERQPLEYLASFHSHPRWIVERWLQRFGFAATEALCAYDNRRPELCLRVNRRRATREELLARLPGSTPGVWSPVSVRCGTAAYGAIRQCVEAGLGSVQDESGMLVAPLLRPEPGQRLLDLAAAPGGKACHLAELLDGSGCVLAFDRNAAKLARLRENTARLGLENLVAASADSRRLQTEPGDAVLLDAPCSGLGVLARRPDLRWRKRREDLVRLQAVQLELLAAASSLVAPRGLLVYSVCTFEPEETLEVAQRFGAAHPEFEPEDAGLPEPLRAAAGILYFLPQRHGIDGGFVARWRRRG